MPRSVWTITDLELKGLVAMSFAVTMPVCVVNMLNALNDLEIESHGKKIDVDLV